MATMSDIFSKNKIIFIKKNTWEERNNKLLKYPGQGGHLFTFVNQEIIIDHKFNHLDTVYPYTLEVRHA